MQIVIDILEKVYNALTHIDFDASLVVDEMRNSIANGTPLPKGHGRLIDADALGKEIYRYTEAPYLYALKRFEEAPTIIKAERDWKDTVKMLKSLPSVTPQPKTEVLDKIRAEVKALPNANPSYSGYIDVVDREDVFEIIDKYKTESEE